ncbi:MAG: dehypoxanthine futalosine cyclase [Cryomorphaceae bacterium BACL11 MAG-121015-bin20]|nr:MAG: dehypoxanthine futalosine cyclase [Cryomorphaceae bacterium BACL11 MAG-121015-bin20]
MDSKQLLNRALKKEFLSAEEGQFLFENTPTAELMFVANELRQLQVPGNVVTWQIDRNVNTTNACTANCKFCNFFRHPKHEEVYITDLETYKVKIEETIEYGGDQLLLQGGHHPGLGLDYYTQLFIDLKALYPNIKLHTLGPPEVAHICKIGGHSHLEALTALKKAGMDSMPGAGAEILSDRVRRLISKGKCSGQEWLDIMKVAHQIGLTTSATMMFGHIETIEERFDHLVRIREVQSQKPEKENGFLAFIAWPFMDDGTLLQRVKGINNNVTSDEYLRMVAICRIMLPNIKNIQTSWLTVGADTAQLTLHGGANDMGSIMIEENVVSAAGAPHRFTANSMQKCIKEAGFAPQLRNQLYEKREMPKMVEQVINY